MTFLGRDFLTVLYSQLQADCHGVVLVACQDGKLVGFVAGVFRQRGFYARAVRRHKWAFAYAAVGATLRRPSIVPRLLRALRRPAVAQQSVAEAALMSMAVRPGVAGRGVGQRLARAALAELGQRGAPTVCLTTDRDGNDRQNRFFQQLGFRVSSIIVTPEGRPMNEYVVSLPLKD